MNRDKVQAEALEATRGKNRCGLGLATGVGKTLVALNHLEEHYSPLLNVLVVAPKKSIFDSWKSEAKKFDKAKLLINITFTTYLSINKQDPREYDIVYLDECHSLLDSHRAFLDEYNGKILGLTGTPPKYANSVKGRLVNEFCPIVYEFVTDNAVENNILNDYQIIVPSKKIFDVLTKLHGNSYFAFDQLIDITAIDYPEKSTRFEVVYLLLSTITNQRLTVKIYVNEGELVQSSVSIFKSANWSEREIWDMFGIFFSGHPDLRRLLTDYGFEGHPLRKDFPLTGRVQVKYDTDQNKVIYEPVNLVQEYRDFDFLSPWERPHNKEMNDTGDKN